jgi:hypothetical protein
MHHCPGSVTISCLLCIFIACLSCHTYALLHSWLAAAVWCVDTAVTIPALVSLCLFTAVGAEQQPYLAGNQFGPGGPNGLSSWLSSFLDVWLFFPRIPLLQLMPAMTPGLQQLMYGAAGGVPDLFGNAMCLYFTAVNRFACSCCQQCSAVMASIVDALSHVKANTAELTGTTETPCRCCSCFCCCCCLPVSSTAAPCSAGHQLE